MKFIDLPEKAAEEDPAAFFRQSRLGARLVSTLSIR